VCFRSKTDTFMIVEFDQPSHGYYGIDSWSPVLNAFSFQVKEKPSVSRPTRQLWLDEHKDDLVYSAGGVYLYLYQNGIIAELKSDWGKWSRPAKPAEAESPSFEGAYSWLETRNLKNGDKFAEEDDPKHGHISIDPSRIYVHYSYENGNNGLTDYTLRIQRSTRRFIETFNPTGGQSFEDSGTCMAFK
jgi:hypothetical protein